MKGIAFFLLVSFLHSVLSNNIDLEKWSGEWGVHVSPGVDPNFLHKLGFKIIKPIGNLQDTYLVKHNDVSVNQPLSQIGILHSTLQSHPNVIYSGMQYKNKMEKRQYVPIQDPMYPLQWHLNNAGQNNGTIHQDINIVSAWKLGFNGDGVRIAFVDDGIEYSHPDLAAGYQPLSSFNINDASSDPSPGFFDYHGTAAAGVALARNNSECGVGAAYMANSSGIRLLAKPFSDADSSQALIFSNDVNDIYVNSWGPSDDGETIAGPGYFTKKAIESGLKEGRRKLGSIFVWAAGNGLLSNENCNYDGFANHRGTIAVGAVDNKGVQAYYSEPCAAMLVTAPSSSREVGITTTDILGPNGYSEGNCTSDFGDTSSACPLVAGVVALMLQANADLTWRDVQFILLSTADQNDKSDSDWVKNGAGYYVNHKYGFGRVNAYKAVQKAQKNYKYIPETQTNNATVPDNSPNGLTKTVEVKKSFVIEHVQVTLSIPNFFSAGDLKIMLISPAGTTSVLAEPHAINTILLTLISVASMPQFGCSPAQFGPAIVTPIVGDVVVVPSLCEISTIDVLGKIVLVGDSYYCSYTSQVYNAQQMGAIAVIVGFEISSYPPSMPGSLDSIVIPSMMVGRGGWEVISDEIALNGNVSVSISPFTTKGNISYDGWAFSTVRNWGENTKGTWTLKVIDSVAGNEAYIDSWTLTIYGHSKPLHLPYWALGIIIGGVLVVIFIVSFIWYRRNQKRGGFRQLN